MCCVVAGTVIVRVGGLYTYINYQVGKGSIQGRFL